MTVSELIDRLYDMPQEARVYVYDDESVFAEATRVSEDVMLDQPVPVQVVLII